MATTSDDAETDAHDLDVAAFGTGGTYATTYGGTLNVTPQRAPSRLLSFYAPVGRVPGAMRATAWLSMLPTLPGVLIHQTATVGDMS
jgi:hypothetical protein